MGSETCGSETSSETIRTPPSLIHLLCSLLCHHCCLLALLRALWEGCSSMHDEKFVRRGEKVQYTWRLVFFALWWCSVYACDCHCSWCVCVSTSPSCCRQCLGTHPYFYSSGMVLFTLQFRTVPCHAVLAWVLKLCNAGMPRHGWSTVWLHLH